MQFEKQQYQEDCVNNIMEILRPLAPNFIDIPALRTGLHEYTEYGNFPIADDARLDVLMETGTGKTFTYIKTMYEMNKEFGTNKFLIFVPRLAIRAGIIQNIKLTADYFAQEYNGKRLTQYTYDKSLDSVNNYLRNHQEFSVLILTSASITAKNDKSRILTRKGNEGSLMKNLSALEEINELKPFIFIDEPHLLKGSGFLETYNKHFSDSFLIRFGATFPDEKGSELSNVIYAMDSITAFRSHLVKKIRVTTFKDDRFDIRFSKINNTKEAEIIYPEGNIEHKKIITKDDDIGVITGKEEYAGVHITRIRDNKVHLSNGDSLESSAYTLDHETIREMVKATISKHFEKEQSFFEKNIKTLSLFFIRNISDFRDTQGGDAIVKIIFEEEYIKARTDILNSDISEEYKNYLERDFNEEGELKVHQGYFSGDSINDEKIGKEVSLILEKKTQLLKPEEPLRFIFSVWALQEGWDNPNIFNICKLNSTKKEISRRQQVGRGLRLCVDTLGARKTIKRFPHDEAFYEVNMLDMFVSSQEGDFIKEIQDEIISNSFVFGGDRLAIDALKPMLTDVEAVELIVFLTQQGAISIDTDGSYKIENPPLEDCIRENKDSLSPALAPAYDKLMKMFEGASSFVEDGNKTPEEIKIRQDKLLEFKELWQNITKKAQINYGAIDEDVLIKSVASAFNKENISKRHIIRQEKIYHHEQGEGGEIEAKDETHGETIEFFSNESDFQNFIFNFSKDSQLPISFVVKLFNQLERENIKNDPHKAKNLLQEILNEEIHKSVVESVGYNFSGEIQINDGDPFFDTDGTPRQTIAAGKIGKYPTNEEPADHYLYDKIRYDSQIEKVASVKSNAASTVNAGEITVFAKLPRLSIPTPYRHYNPDFAYYINTKEGKKIFFIVETKGYDSERAIPSDERANIAYARKFFQQLNDEVGDDIEVIFKQRINRDNLTELLQDIGSEK